VTRRLLLTRVSALLSVVGLLGIAAGPTAFAAKARIRPHQSFEGFVNDRRPVSTIDVACVGPAETGHPLGGQTVSVEPGVSGSDGYTGSKGYKIKVLFVTPTATISPDIIFERYRSLPIPTTVTLPCSGTVVVSFVPLPSSSSARADSVRVTFDRQP
jgi:hypothetical protein